MIFHHTSKIIMLKSDEGTMAISAKFFFDLLSEIEFIIFDL